jgi:hypothetical protein
MEENRYIIERNDKTERSVNGVYLHLVVVPVKGI